MRICDTHVEWRAERYASVMLQAMKEEPPLNTKCKDKFLVQSTIITSEKEAMPLSELVRPPNLPRRFHVGLNFFVFYLSVWVIRVWPITRVTVE